MNERVDPAAAMRMATDIVVAFLGSRSVDPAELPALVREVRAALAVEVPESSADNAGRGASLDVQARVSEPDVSGDGVIPKPAVPIEESITPDFLISLEDGAKYRTLKRHLRLKYGMTPDQYRAKWGLAADYPMAAPKYAADRSAVAKRIGLGSRAKHSLASSAETRKVPEAAAKSSRSTRTRFPAGPQKRSISAVKTPKNS